MYKKVQLESIVENCTEKKICPMQIGKNLTDNQNIQKKLKKYWFLQIICTFAPLK
jgi:hypothetical protein